MKTLIGDTPHLGERATPFHWKGASTRSFHDYVFPAQPGKETAYSLRWPDHVVLKELPSETAYTFEFPARKRRLEAWPQLPLLIEELFTTWRCGTVEMVEIPNYNNLGVALVQPADFGTRYDVVFVVHPALGPEGSSGRSVTSIVRSRTRNTAEELRELTGLPVDRLAHVLGVSRVTYHNWIAERPIGLENERRLQTVLSLLRQIRDLRGFDTDELRGWLLAPLGPDGTAPLDLLARGSDVQVRTHALRSERPTPDVDELSDQAVARAGIPRTSIRRVGSRGWGRDLRREVLRDRLEQLAPTALFDPDELDEEEVHVEVGWGLYHP